MKDMSNHAGTVHVERSGCDVTLNEQGWMTELVPSDEDIVTVYDGDEPQEMTYLQYCQLYKNT